MVSTPAERSLFSSRVKTLTSTTFPRSPCGIFRDVSLTSRDFSPKIARSRRSSGVNSFSPLGVIFPTKISLGPTSAPIRIIPFSSRSLMASSPTFGISRVISSGPSLVSRASNSYFSIWTEENLSSITTLSEIKMASSKFPPSQETKATTIFCPKANCPSTVEEESASTSFFLTFCPLITAGRWSIQVLWFERWYFRSWCVCSIPLLSRTMIWVALTETTSPSSWEVKTWPESTAAYFSIPVETSGMSGFTNGTACACMLEPISARLASSCSKNGISAALTPTTCCGETSI